jgi:hypothetical protein
MGSSGITGTKVGMEEGIGGMPSGMVIVGITGMEVGIDESMGGNATSGISGKGGSSTFGTGNVGSGKVGIAE